MQLSALAHRTGRRLSKPAGHARSGVPRGNGGFTLFEVLVAGVVMVIGLVFIAHFFTSTAMRVLASDTRSLMGQVANQQLETIRGLQYQDIGTVGGNPAGLLPQVENITVEGRTFEVKRKITYYTDPSYSGPYEANYRRVVIEVDAVGSSALEPVVVSTNIAGGAKGGMLDVTVTNLAGEPLPNVNIVVTDDLLIPNVLISGPAYHTNSDGHLAHPGLKADPNPGYFVSANLSGYNDVALKTGVVVANATTTAVQLIMDRFSNMNIHLTDQFGTPIAGRALRVTGFLSVSPWTFTQTVTTDAGGDATLSNIRYSTSLEPYFIELVTPQTPPLQFPDGVTAPTVDGTFLPLPAGKLPVILAPGSTQTVDLQLNTTPIVSALSPASGSPSGGTSVVITGVNLSGATAVKFGAVDAASFTVNSDTQITAISAGGTDTVDVTVTTPLGTSGISAADHFTYVALPPTVTSVTPSTGLKVGGTTVIIHGTNFNGATLVRFGTKSATFTVDSTTQITATAPSGSNTVSIRVTTPGGVSADTAADNYRYVNRL